MTEPEANSSMDQAAEDARREIVQQLSHLDPASIIRWWKKWYLKAGHKRLGRILLELDSESTKLLSTGAPPLRKSSSHLEDALSNVSFTRSEKPQTPFNKISRAANLIRNAERTVLKDVVSGLVKDEEGITERLIGAVHQQFNNRTYSGVRWSAMTLTAHKRGAQESWCGADVLGVLHVKLKDYSVQKGFLAQAKYLRNSDRLSVGEFDRLKDQCRSMLDHSSASFVFLYQKEGISVVPAVAVVALADPSKLSQLKRRDLGKFFEEHFDCFVGDPALHTANDQTLEDLQKRAAACRVLQLVGKAND